MDIGDRVRERKREREREKHRRHGEKDRAASQEETLSANDLEQTEPSSPVTQQQKTPTPTSASRIDWKEFIVANFGNPDELIQPGENAVDAFYRLRAKNQTPEVFAPTSSVLVSGPIVPRTSSRATVTYIKYPKSTLTDALKPKEETNNSQAESTSESIESVTVLTSTPPSQDQPTVTTAEENGNSVTDLAESTLDVVATSTTRSEINSTGGAGFFESHKPSTSTGALQNQSSTAEKNDNSITKPPQPTSKREQESPSASVKGGKGNSNKEYFHFYKGMRF